MSKLTKITCGVVAATALGLTTVPVAHASDSNYLADVQQIPAFAGVSTDAIMVYGHTVCHMLTLGEPSQLSAIAKAITNQYPQVSAQDANKLVTSAERDLC